MRTLGVQHRGLSWIDRAGELATGNRHFTDCPLCLWAEEHRLHAIADRSIDRAKLPDDVEALKDLLVQAGAAFQALRQQANAQMATLAAQMAEFERRVFGVRGEALCMLHPELWHEVVRIPVPPRLLTR